MPLKRIFFGPDWQSRDPERRLRALSEQADSELLEALPRIAREDPDERVRLAALKRLDDPRRYLEAARSDPSPELRREAHALAMRQLSGERPCALAESELAQLASEWLSEAETESLLRRARLTAVRRALLAKTNRLGLLVDVALSDPDPELRRLALERIEDREALEKLARRAQSKDKRMAALARERLAALAGDTVTTQQAVEELCREAEIALRDPPRDPAAMLERLTKAACALDLPEQDPRMRRLRNALAILAGFAKRRDGETAATEPAASSPEPPAPALVPPSTAPIAANADVASTANLDPSAALPTEAGPAEENDAKPRNLLQDLAKALEDGAIAKAEQLAATLRGMSLAGTARTRFHALSRKLAELRRWKAWTLREHRERLLQELSALSSSGLHPDGLATRVRELRAEWAQLNREMPAPPALEGRFHALARAVLAPARAFFRRRDELRARRCQEIEELLASVESALAAPRDEEAAPSRQTAGALAVMRRRLAAAARELPDLSPRDRARLGERLRRALASLDQRRALEAKKALQAKRNLLERLEQALSLPPERALRQLERIEAEWQRLGRARPAEEAPLRTRFAELAARIRETHRASELSAKRAEAERCAQAEALLRRIEEPVELTLAEVERFAEAARDLRPLPRELQQALGRALDGARRRVQAACRARITEELKAKLDPLPVTGNQTEDVTSAVRRCCVVLEELAGLPTPAEDAALRLRVQMERLAAKLGQGADQDPLVLARATLEDWRHLAGRLTEPAPFAARLERAIETLAARLYPDPPEPGIAAGSSPP